LEDGTLVVDGITILLSVLTELEIDPQIGDLVNVEAVIKPDGSLVAREIKAQGRSKKGREGPSKVEIEGTIDVVNPDGSLVVNGITVIISELTEVKGNLLVGAQVKLEGVLQEDGTLLAYEAKTQGRRPSLGNVKLSLAGFVESILRDSDGNILSIVVNGATVTAEALTQFDGLLEVGAWVEVNGLTTNGQVVAGKITGGEHKGSSKAEEALERGRAKAEAARERAEEKADKASAQGRDEGENGRGKGRGKK